MKQQKLLICLMCICLSSITWIWAQQRSVAFYNYMNENSVISQYDISIDWQRQEMNFLFFLNRKQVETNRMQAFYILEQLLQDELVEYILNSLMSIRVDSYDEFQNFIFNNDNILYKFTQIETEQLHKLSYPLQDMRYLLVEYILPISPLITSLLVPPTQAVSPLPYILNTGHIMMLSEDYTGILIYAANPLQVHGEDKMELLNPSIFLDIYQNNLDVLVETNMMDTEFLRQWGSALYTIDIENEQVVERIGTHPIKIVAQGVFGNNYTDPIISKNDAIKLLASENNRKLLQQGRIAIVVHDSKIIETIDQKVDE